MNPLLHRRVHRRKIEYRALHGALFVDRASGEPATTPEQIARAIAATPIRQGELGNCHFLAAVGAVAHRAPERLATRFVESSAQGCTVRFFRSGAGSILGPLRSVPLVRDLGPRATRCEDLPVSFEFPVFADTGEPAFVKPYVARSGLFELWLLALEKAYARYHRAYFLSQAGFGANALSLLTGLPVQLGPPWRFGEEALRAAVAEGEVVLATTWPNLFLPGRLGLPAGHPQKLSPVHVYEIRAAVGSELVLRNPHGPELVASVTYRELVQSFVCITRCRV